MSKLSFLSYKTQVLIIALSLWNAHFVILSQNKIHLKDLENNAYKPIKNAVNVLVFLDTECPISQQYVRELETLRLAFSQENIHFCAIFPTKGVTKHDVVVFQKKYNFLYECIIDYDKKLTIRLNAKTTPEVFIVNDKNKIFYQGAIDNLYYDLGKKRLKASIFYLKNALNNIIEHQPITIKSIQAVGCDIER